MNEIESIKRHLEQLKSQLNKINSYHGWLYVWTQDETMVFMDITIDSELRALIKRKLEDSIKFCEEQLKENENEPKS
ncbi:hypothetical protein ABNB59_14785 [Paenibacillus larvae]|uniref:Uncharacterized protein n=14 Tax=root TaxID=1 RepID=R9W0P6_9CAUD|nr:hypothetical protein [Paenibacillus larvae]YP_008320376.1 hypothetical protein IBBPl23_37 [Paenibacillus phage phiIBB_P123]YP_009193864.1 hypothetical protein HARRISON_51 [Paenibacillus phage Harrison]YP_009203241.1 hypothetical protein FERN_39 [Paenibacillus phage Fern]YP_009593448.1 hypothetical protein FDG84_gp39 [Paenibacillus phage Willow]YP_009836656.1 hypothetical protein HWB48_gp37 [Paenibacillus phage Likha]YP_009838673.1 hypothetical protein HWB70_gp42 [Paenibacillus phage Yyerff